MCRSFDLQRFRHRGTRAMSDLQTPYYLIDLAKLRVNMERIQ